MLVEGLKNNGQTFSSYLKVNPYSGQLQYFQENPDRESDKYQEIQKYLKLRIRSVMELLIENERGCHHATLLLGAQKRLRLNDDSIIPVFLEKFLHNLAKCETRKALSYRVL